MQDIPYSRQLIEDDDIRAVTEALRGRLLTQGPLLAEFERQVANYCGARFAIAFSNGTAALHGACHVLGLKKNEEGITTPISFLATANCLLYVGAKPRFSDVQEGLPLLDVDRLESGINEKTRVILPVHFAGAPVNMPKLAELAQRYHLKIIEDGCHALGAGIKDPKTGQETKIGSCEYSDMTVFSFHPVKSITTLEGGMVTTNDEGYYRKLKSFRNHGVYHPQPEEGRPGWYYEMEDLGWNYRLTEVQSALGLSQIKKLDQFIAARREQFLYYQEQLKNQSLVKLLLPSEPHLSSHHLCILKFEEQVPRDLIFQKLRAAGFFCQLHYIPIYRHPYYQQHFSVSPQHFPQAENYFRTALSIPLYPGLNQKDQDRFLELLRDLLAPYEDVAVNLSARKERIGLYELG